MKYQTEWLYSDVEENASPVDPTRFDIHVSFLLRFPHIPPGNGHVAHFCLNVLSPGVAEELGISKERRGFLIRDRFSYSEIVETVETIIAEIFAAHSHDEALRILNGIYIHDDLDFSAEFAPDLKSAEEVLGLIADAFADVTRGDGLTLHQAAAIDNYATQAEFDAARGKDTDTRWQEIPDKYIADNPGYMIFLDSEGFRYHLPANMSWSVRNYADADNDSAFSTFLRMFPTVAPREIGRGLGDNFDVQAFIDEFSLTKNQVRAIYAFLCFMAITAEFRIEEDRYPAMIGWQKAAMDQ